MVSDQTFLDKGFTKYKPDYSFDNRDIEACFQKRYDDEQGKKYFITAKKWSGFTHPYTGETFNPAYEYHIQLLSKDDRNAVDLLFHSSWELEDVEKYVEEIWKTGLFDYYAKDIDIGP